MNAEKISIDGMICKKRFGGKYDFVDDEVECRQNIEVIYGGFFWPQWGHFLIDIIGRLWYAVKQTDIPIVFIVDKKNKERLRDNYLELISLFGIDINRIICTSSLVQYRTIVVPETSFYPGKYFSQEYKMLIQIAKRNALYKMERETAYEKIFFSRRKFPTNEIGEVFIESIMRKNGYVILHPELLSVSEQIFYIEKATYIASLSGTCAHNAIWGDDAHQWIIFEREQRVNPYQIQLQRVSGTRQVFVDAYKQNNKLLGEWRGINVPALLGKTDYVNKFISHNNLSYSMVDSVTGLLCGIKFFLVVIKRRLICKKND